jgi:hypothetical protein
VAFIVGSTDAGWIRPANVAQCAKPTVCAAAKTQHKFFFFQKQTNNSRCFFAIFFLRLMLQYTSDLTPCPIKKCVLHDAPAADTDPTFPHVLIVWMLFFCFEYRQLIWQARRASMRGPKSCANHLPESQTAWVGSCHGRAMDDDDHD